MTHSFVYLHEVSVISVVFALFICLSSMIKAQDPLPNLSVYVTVQEKGRGTRNAILDCVKLFKMSKCNCQKS